MRSLLASNGLDAHSYRTASPSHPFFQDSFSHLNKALLLGTKWTQTYFKCVKNLNPPPPWPNRITFQRGGKETERISPGFLEYRWGICWADTKQANYFVFIFLSLTLIEVSHTYRAGFQNSTVTKTAKVMMKILFPLYTHQLVKNKQTKTPKWSNSSLFLEDGDELVLAYTWVRLATDLLRTFSVLAPTMWNSLPAEVRKLPPQHTCITKCT